MRDLIRLTVMTIVVAAVSFALMSCKPAPDAQSDTPGSGTPRPRPSTTEATASFDLDLRVRSIGGITPGETTDHEVVALYGAGGVVNLEGGGRERYYTDEARTFTLRVVADAEGVVRTLQLGAREFTPTSADLSAARPLVAPIETDRGINLGDNVNSIPQVLGRITRDDGGPGVAILVYESELPGSDGAFVYRGTYTCLNGDLTDITLYVGE